MGEIFDESHYFICSNGMKPARMRSNQKVMLREDGKYYLTERSLTCIGADFSCRWIALVAAILCAAIALLCASGVGVVLLAALVGAAAGAFGESGFLSRPIWRFTDAMRLSIVPEST